MSIESVAQALNLTTDLHPTEKLVLIGIANHDGDGGSWPSLATLSRYAGCSVRQVRRCIRELETRGLIETIQHGGGSKTTRNDRRPNLYRLHLRNPQPVDNDVDGRTQDVRPSAHGGTHVSERGDMDDRHGGTHVSGEPSYEPSMNRAPHPSDDVTSLEDVPAGRMRDRLERVLAKGSGHET